MRAWIWLAGLLAAACLSAADGWHRPFIVLGPDQGLPNGGITCLAQDGDGFLWLGTENGILRFEGGQCSQWTRRDGLPSDNVERIVPIPGPGGGLWVTTSRRLVRFQNGRFDLARFEAQVKDAAVRAIALDRQGRLWAATNRGLFVQGQGLAFLPHPSSPAGQILTVDPGRQGAMLVGTDQGLFRLQEDGRIQTWSQAQGIPDAGAALAGEEASGRIWVCSGRALAALEPGASRFQDRSDLMPAGVTPNGLFHPDPNGDLWLPTQLGALRLSAGQGALLDSRSGLPMRWVRNVLRDQEGALWVLGTSLARLQGNDRVWNHPLTGGPSGLPVWGLSRRADGTLLLGTDDGLFRLDGQGVHRLPGTEGRRLKSHAFDRTGRLWMVGTTGPALWMEPGAPRAVLAPLGELGAQLNTVFVDGSGQVWMGHPSRGLLRWNAEQRRVVQDLQPELSPSGMLSVFQVGEDAQRRIWAASNLGLHLREASGVWRLYTERDGLLPFGLYGFAFHPDGSAWVFSREAQGLQRIRFEGDRLVVLDHRKTGQGLHSDRIYAVAVDTQGRTWASTDRGLDCVDIRLHLGRRDGMISEDCDILSLLADAGHVWVGTSAGLVRYETGTEEVPHPTPRPHVLYALIGSQRFDYPSGALPAVPPREPNLAFRIAAPRDPSDAESRIQFRLLGLDSTWRDLDAPLARFPGLAGGSYRLEVRTAQVGSDYSPVASLAFRVKPVWWQSWWAGLLGLVGLVGLGALLQRARVVALARTKAALEATVVQRTEELTQRNRELTEALGKVKQLSGLLPICAQCKKIRDDRGYWNQLEHYLSQHTDVGFSHGICPECADHLFPGRNRDES